MGQNFVSTLSWTATDRDTATWSSGTIKTTSGVSYSISGGNTGNIVATTYIYLNINTSVTVLQQSTTATDAAGSGKILIATVQIGPVGGECIINVVNSPGTTIDGGKIVTGSITATKIATGELVVGTNVGLGTAQTASQVTTIVGNTVTTSFINALNVNAASVSASISISSPSITGGSIAIGSSNAIFKADSNGIYLGNATFASAPFRVDMNGNVTANNLTAIGKVTSANTNDKVVLDSDDYLKFYSGGNLKAQLRGTTNGAGGVFNSGDYFTANNRSYWIQDSTAASDKYGGMSITNGNQMWLTLGTDNTLYVKNNAQNDNYFTVSHDRAYHRAEFEASTGNFTTINNTTLNGNTIWYWNLNHYSTGFRGDPFPILASVKSSTPNPKKNAKWSELIHSSLDREIFVEKTEKDGRITPGIDIGKLIMIQNEAINLLYERIQSLEKQLIIKPGVL